MKYITTLLAAATLLASPALHAQAGGGATAATTSAGTGFGWAVALGGLAVVGVVTGIVASSASATPASFNH